MAGGIVSPFVLKRGRPRSGELIERIRILEDELTARRADAQDLVDLTAGPTARRLAAALAALAGGSRDELAGLLARTAGDLVHDLERFERQQAMRIPPLAGADVA
jgi:hypothetical protein